MINQPGTRGSGAGVNQHPHRAPSGWALTSWASIGSPDRGSGHGKSRYQFNILLSTIIHAPSFIAKFYRTPPTHVDFSNPAHLACSLALPVGECYRRRGMGGEDGTVENIIALLALIIVLTIVSKYR